MSAPDSECIHWVSASDGKCPPNAIKGGVYNDGTLFVGRVLHGREVFPGKVASKLGGIYISWDLEEVKYTDYEVLVFDPPSYTDAEPVWEKGSNGHIPKGAIVAGTAENEEPVCIGRCYIDTAFGQEIHPGRISLVDKCCYIPWCKAGESLQKL